MQPEKAKQSIDKNRAKAAPKPARATKKSSPKTKSDAKPALDSAKKVVPKSATKKATKVTNKPAAKSAPKKSHPAKKASTKMPLQITFQVAFATQFGQVIKVGGNHPELGDGSDEKALELNFADVGHWAGQTNIDRASLPEEGLQYYYLIQQADGTIDKSSSYKLLPDSISAKTKHVFLQDAWNSPAFMENAFSTDVFKVLLNTPKKSKSSIGTHFFSVKAPQLPEQHVICLLGDHAQLGGWDTGKVILLQPDSDSNAWQISLPLKSSGETIQYKYGIYDTAASQFMVFESGDNRILNTNQPAVDQVQIHDGFVRTH